MIHQDVKIEDGKDENDYIVSIIYILLKHIY